MRWPRLYLDEDVAGAVASGLRRRGYDVLTTVEAGRAGSTDEQQPEFAISDGRCLFSFNRGDFGNYMRRPSGAGSTTSASCCVSKYPSELPFAG